MRMENKTLIGIDPGAKGGIAILRPGGEVTTINMPHTPTDLCNMIKIVQAEAMSAIFSGRPGSGQVKCYLEQVGGYVGKGKGKRGQPGSAMFKFGKGVGQIEGILIALEIPFETVRPQTWQKCFEVGKASACPTKTVWKNKLKAKAQALYPSIGVTLGTSDALLILEYGRRLENMAAPQPNQPEMALA